MHACGLILCFTCVGTIREQPVMWFDVAVQVIACAGDMYYIDKTYSKRTYELIFGSVLMIFAFVPVRASFIKLSKPIVLMSTWQKP